jgi:hypothetical protein
MYWPAKSQQIVLALLFLGALSHKNILKAQLSLLLTRLFQLALSLEYPSAPESVKANVGANAMSEYLDGLRRKAREIEKKQGFIQQRLRDDHEELVKLTAAREGIQALLRLEGATMDDGPVQGNLAVNGGISPISTKVPPLAEVLKEALADGRARDINELIKAAQVRGVDFGGKDPWKSVNFTLMGIKTGNAVERVDGNRWRRAG